MKTNILILLFLLFFPFYTNSQSLNNEISIEGETPFLLGKIDKNGFKTDNYASWFTKNHDDYQPDGAITTALYSKLKDYDITLFLGTWCGDSKREVPRFYKILEASNYPMEQLTSIALSRKKGMYKQSPEGHEKGLNIHRVPTFIIYKDGKEINRIVEEPVETLEKDLLNIISGEHYTSSYYIVTEIDNILKTSGLKGLKKTKRTLIKTYQNKLTGLSELNTYAYILFSTNREQEAIEVCKLNIHFFQEDSYVYQSLARKYELIGKYKKAKRLYKKALQLDPKTRS